MNSRDFREDLRWIEVFDCEKVVEAFWLWRNLWWLKVVGERLKMKLWWLLESESERES